MCQASQTQARTNMVTLPLRAESLLLTKASWPLEPQAASPWPTSPFSPSPKSSQSHNLVPSWLFLWIFAKNYLSLPASTNNMCLLFNFGKFYFQRNLLCRKVEYCLCKKNACCRGHSQGICSIRAIEGLIGLLRPYQLAKSDRSKTWKGFGKRKRTIAIDPEAVEQLIPKSVFIL